MNIISMLVHVGFCSGLALVLTGCMSLTSVYDKHFGEIAHTARAIQMLNPNAPMNSDPISGVDGYAATSAMGHYNAQYCTPQSDASALTVGVSSGNNPDSTGR